MHPRNRHAGRYDLARLAAAVPELAAYLRAHPHIAGEQTVDFADERAVRALNRAILAADYGVAGWDVPPGYLCPPIPGRADYVHHLADLLDGDGIAARGPGITLLDVGVGANGVYPLIGRAEYGWRFVGADIDARALAALSRVLDANPAFAQGIELRRQADPARRLGGIWRAGECFDATICNPPFHASAAEAREGTARKWRGLGQAGGGGGRPALNFGGQSNELWCEGGERAFVLGLVRESVRYGRRCRWFSTLVSKSVNLPAVSAALRAAGVRDAVEIDTSRGQKKSRIVAWSFLDRPGRHAFAKRDASDGARPGQ